MRKLALSAVVLLGASSTGFAAPIDGYETLYQRVFTDCTIPAGTVVLCEAAINGYADAIVTAVDLAVANQSFSALRLEVFEGNAADEPFQTEIDALFELLLPDSGALGALASP